MSTRARTRMAFESCSSPSVEKMATSWLLTTPKDPRHWRVGSKPLSIADATPKQPDAIALKKRLQYKLYQRRHRAKQRDKTQLLELHVSQLQQEVEQLQRLKDQASIALQPSSTCAATTTSIALVREYFRLFEHGRGHESRQQSEFVHVMMDDNVRGSQIKGVDDLLSQWEIYSQIFSRVHLAQRGFRAEVCGGLTVVEAKTTLTLQLGDTSISSLFPNLPEEDVAASNLAGAPLIVKGSLRFVFGSERGRVNWLGSEMDFFGALLNACGSLAKLTQGTQGSRMDFSSGYVASPCKKS